MSKSKKTKKPRNSLTIYSLKEEIEAPDDAVKRNSELNHDTLTLGGVEAELYIQPERPRYPNWSRLLTEVVDFKKMGIGSSSSAGVLIVPAAGRLFALTFGWGRHLLHPGVWEERFGLKVALNAIDPKSVRSIDRKSFESLGRQVQEQATRPAEATDFGLDIETDMLRAVTGTPLDPAMGLRVTGKDSLVANVEFGLDGIPGYLVACDKLAKDTSYKTNYPWVDHIAEVTDARLRDRLDEKLVKRLQEENFDRLWLAVPDRIDWGQVDAGARRWIRPLTFSFPICSRNSASPRRSPSSSSRASGPTASATTKTTRSSDGRPTTASASRSMRAIAPTC